ALGRELYGAPVALPKIVIVKVDEVEQAAADRVADQPVRAVGAEADMANHALLLQPLQHLDRAAALHGHLKATRRVDAVPGVQIEVVEAQGLELLFDQALH